MPLTPDDRGPHRRRLLAALLVPVVVAAGLGVRAASSGAIASVAGDVLYATLVYALVVVVVPRSGRAVVATAALAVCLLVELSQLTGAPAALAEAWWPVRYVLGTSFAATDLLLYAVGVMLGACVDRVASRR